MKRSIKIRERGKGFLDSMIRFPLVIVLLIAAVITNTISINQDFDDIYVKLLISFLLGACIYAVFQMFYERFCIKQLLRYLYMGVTLILTSIYYLVIKTAEWDVEVTLRTMVFFFLLLIAFLWIPVIKSKYNFNDSFMAAFKALFVALFFNGILFLGITLIFSVTDLLIFNVDERAYAHTANIIFILLAPIHILSLIPYYPKKQELEQLEQSDALNIETLNKETLNKETLNKETSARQSEQSNENIVEEISGTEPFPIVSIEVQRKEEAVKKLITPAKFLETLISYVVIPIAAIFTIILLLYIIMNITGDFWTDNLMEPLLVSYSITVIIVYLLSSTINNVFTKYFRLVFPKVLVPIVLFQTLASILKIGDSGITYGRYYVIMFGLFATVSAVLFCIKPIRKNGIIAPVLIALSLISILPFVGAFTISKANQIGRLETVLERNNMLEGDVIIPNANISESDKQIIISAVGAINSMQYAQSISWLKDYNKTYNFEETFGFAEYGETKNNGLYVRIIRNQNSPITITGYDNMVRMYLYRNNNEVIPYSFEKDGRSFALKVEGSYDKGYEIVLYEADIELIGFTVNTIYDKFVNDREEISVDTPEVTFTQENDKAALTIVAENISINQWEDGKDQEADIYVLVRIK